jgi:capsular exopolysaccharide synthesis family protein
LVDSDQSRALPKGQERYFGAVELMRMLRRRQWLIAATMLSITGAVGSVAYTLTPQYTASSEVMIEPEESHVVDTKRVVGTPAASQPLIETHVELLQSRKLAERLVEDLDLVDDPEFAPNAAAEWSLDIAARVGRGLVAYIPPDWREAGPVKRALKNVRKLFNRAETFLVPDRPPIEPLGATVKSVIGRLASRIEAEQVGKSHVISVKVTSNDPEKAALLANRLTELYLDQLRETKSLANAEAVRWLNTRVDELRQQLMASERMVASYLQEKQLPSGRHDDITLAQMDRLNSQLAVASGQRAEAEARHRGLQALLQVGGEGVETGARVANSPLLSDLRGQEAGLLRRIAELSATYGDRHPLLVKAKAELQELRERSNQEVRRLVEDLSNQVTVAKAREAQLAAGVNELQERSLRQGTTNVALRDLERDAETNRQLYVSFLARLKELAEQKDVKDAGAAIVSRAAVPGEPSFPKPERMLGIAVVGSLLIGFMLTFAAEGLDNVVRTSDQLERIVGAPVLAMVPEVKRGGGAPLHHYMVAKPRSAFAEAVRNVHMELSLRSVGRPPKAIVVTSSLPGEGKTSLALCLAAAAASSGHSTCLIDLDLHRPGLRRALKRDGRPDLIEYLAGTSELEAILVPDERIDNLTTIIVRRAPSDPRALIGSPRMTELLDRLRERYALVVIDAPPVLPVRDAKVLAALADTVVFAVRWGKTRDDAAVAAIQTLTESTNTSISAVITRVDLKKHAKRYFGDSIQYYTRYGKYYVN